MSYSDCLNDIAATLKNSSICTLFNNTPQEEQCYGSVASATTNLTECDPITNNSEQQMCHYYVALSFANRHIDRQDICANLSNEDLKTKCIQEVIRYLKP
jgi:hypothetical protein